jgi:O-antigen ligase
MLKVSFGLFLAAVLLAPLPFGSIEDYWIAVWCVVASLSLALVPRSEITAARLRRVLPVLCTVGLFAVIVVAQLSPVGNIGGADPIWAEVNRTLGTRLVSYPSASALASWLSLGPSLLFITIFFASYFLCADVQRANTLLHLVAWAGLIYAVLGIWQLLVDPGSLLWEERKSFTAEVTGTFVNRNTAATYFGSCCIVWLCLLLSAIKSELRDSDPDITEEAHYWPSGHIVVQAGALLICLLALFLTNSRAGIILSTSILVITAAIFLFRTFPRGSKLVLAIAALVLGAMAWLETWGGLLAVRISYEGLFDQSRWLAYKGTLGAIADHPWLGSGLRTFEEVFPAYRSDELASTLLWDVAHNSLLELASDLGIPFAVIFVLLWLYVFVALFRGAVSRRRGVKFPAAAVGVGLLGSLHSLVDFSLQIPGYAVVFSAVIGCGLAQCTRAEPVKRGRPRMNSGPTSAPSPVPS